MDYRLLGEEVLLKLLKASDEAAFREIYNRYWMQLYKKVYAKTRRHDIAEEIVQNVFVKFWENRSVSSILYLENYLHSAIKYQIINYFKSLLAKEKYVKHLKEQHSETEDSSATNLLVHELTAIINKAVHELPEKTRIIFNLSRNGDYTIKEISESMHLSEKAVEYHITKSLKQLRFYLKEIIFLMIAFISAYLLQ